MLPYALEADALRAPIGLGGVTPRLSWKIASSDIGAHSEAWEIEAASSRKLLQAGEADLWKTGCVADHRGHATVYGGEALGSRSEVWWRVRVWDEKESLSAWSEASSFELGLLGPEEWSARWIAGPLWGGPRTCPPAPFFRKDFSVEGKVAKARLYLTALGLFECEINGKAVSDRILAPGWTDFRKRVRVHALDVTDLIQKGVNAIGCVLGEGWYAGHIAHLERQHYGEKPALLAQLELTWRDGTRVSIVSDETWKTRFGPILSNDLLMGESYDARRELPGWSRGGHDESAWQPVECLEFPEIERVPTAGPFVKRQEVLDLGRRPTPLSHRYLSWRGCTDVFDFGQNFVGRVRLRLRGKRGLTLRVRHAEMLQGEELYTENLRSALCVDHYTLKGDVEEVFEPRFTVHGFRFIELFWPASPEDLVVERLEGVVVHSEMPRIGRFSCSNPLLNQLNQNIFWGQKGNFLEVPTDCPQRDERLGWTGDAQVFARTACFNHDVRVFFEKWLQDLRDAQFPDGEVPMVAPRFDDVPQDGGPGWSDATIICPWILWRSYGDARVLENHYESMRRYLQYQVGSCRDWIRAHPEQGGFEGFGDWLALDGAEQTEGRTLKCLIGTAYLAYDCHLMVTIAGVLGKKDDAAAYQIWHDEVKRAFNRRFVTGDGLLASHTQTSYVLALHFDLLPERIRPLATAHLVRLIRANGTRLATGFLGTPHLCQVLEANGHLDLAYTLLERETFPSWLFSVKNGATTIWERWDGWTSEKGFQTPEMNSFNHYAYGAVGAWMYATVAGLDLDPDIPGYRRIRFRPRPGGTLSWAQASLETPLGIALIRWEKADGKLRLTCEVPVNAEAVLSVPEGFAPYREVLCSGRHEIVLEARPQDRSSSLSTVLSEAGSSADDSFFNSLDSCAHSH